jgi:hypothetical protein
VLVRDINGGNPTSYTVTKSETNEASLWKITLQKMYEGNKSVLPFSKKVRNTFKIQNCYFFLSYAM